MIDPLSDFSLSSPSLPPLPPRPQRKLLQPSPDHPDDYILELDYSSAATFITCPRAYENYAIRSREANGDASATSFGKLFHSCEELRLRHGNTEAVYQAQRELVAQHFLHHPPSPTDHRTPDRMLDILKRYNALYATDGWHDNLYQIPGDPAQPFVEVAFKVPLCSLAVNANVPYSPIQITSNSDWTEKFVPFLTIRSLHILYSGRIDAVLHSSNLLWVVDHKTSSMGGREFEEAFNLSLQTRGYTWAATQLLQLPLAGLIMNAVVIRKPTKTGTPTEFSRHPYFYSQDSLEEWHDNMVAICEDLVSCLTRGFFPQTARSFKSPCAMCEYQENCRLPRDQRAADLASGLYRDVTWSPIH